DRLRIATEERGLNTDFRWNDIGKLRDRQAHHRNQADDHRQDSDYHRDDRPVDEETIHKQLNMTIRRRKAPQELRPFGSGSWNHFHFAGGLLAFSANGFGLTAVPSFASWVPSTTTRSPDVRPLV